MAQQEQCAPSDAWARVKSRLRAELGEDVFASWFRGVEVEQVDDGVVHLTVATRFLRNWLRSHYYDFVLRLSRGEWPSVERLEFRVRQPHFGAEAPKEQPRLRRPEMETVAEMAPLPMPLRTGYGGFEGSPLDPQVVLRQLHGRRLEPAGLCRRTRGGGRLLRAAASVQPAVRARQCGLGQNPSVARDLLGREAA